MKHLKLFEAFLPEGKRRVIDPEAFKREDISNLFGNPEDVTFSKDAIRVKALLWIWKYQTEEEKRTNSTHVHNGIGFTGTDAEILSSFAQQVINRHFLSEKQMVILRKKIKKYENQMAKIATAIKKGQDTKDEKINDVMKLWAKENANKYKQTKIEFPALQEAVYMLEKVLEAYNANIFSKLSDKIKAEIAKVIGVPELKEVNRVKFGAGEYEVTLFWNSLGLGVFVQVVANHGNIDDAERLENKLNREIEGISDLWRGGISGEKFSF